MSRGIRAGAVLGAVAVTAMLTACGSSGGGSTATSSGSTSTATAAAKAKSVNLGIITPSTTQNSFQEVARGGQAAADATPGVHLRSAAPNGINGAAEVQLFQAATQSSPDGIAADPVAPPLFVRPFQTAASQNVPVVAVDAAAIPGSKVDTFVGNSNTELGVSLANEIIKKIPADAAGEVVLGNDAPGLQLMTQRLAGIQQVLKKERPHLKILGPFNVGAEPTDNYNHWANLVKAHPNAVAYLAPGAQDAISLARIQKSSGKHYVVGGCDVDPNALQALKDGYVQALADPWHFLKGYIAIRLLAEKAQKGAEIPAGWLNSGSGMVTAANVDAVIARQKDQASRVAFFKETIDKELANPSAYIKPLEQAN
jgi:ribose transport system substrate-binding protein